MEAIADDIVFRPVWRLDDPQTAQDVMRLWSLAGLPPALAKDRKNEICAVAYSGGELAAVSTANIFYSPTMRNNFFSYRCLVAPQFRQHDLAWRLSTYSLNLLREWSAKHAADKRIMGLLICVETDKFEAGLRRPVREKFGFTMHFVAYTPEGQQLRVVWFDDATLDDVAALKRGGSSRTQGVG